MIRSALPEPETLGYRQGQLDAAGQQHRSLKIDGAAGRLAERPWFARVALPGTKHRPEPAVRAGLPVWQQPWLGDQLAGKAQGRRVPPGPSLSVRWHDAAISGCPDG